MKLQYDINREAAKISALSSGKTDTNEYPTGEQILPSVSKKSERRILLIQEKLLKNKQKQLKRMKKSKQKHLKSMGKS